MQVSAWRRDSGSAEERGRWVASAEGEASVETRLATISTTIIYSQDHPLAAKSVTPPPDADEIHVKCGG